jgi:hypothetical protein
MSTESDWTTDANLTQLLAMINKSPLTFAEIRDY